MRKVKNNDVSVRIGLIGNLVTVDDQVLTLMDQLGREPINLPAGGLPESAIPR